MASQSSVEEVATPIENPVTPQADDIDLPSKVDLNHPASLTTSMLVAGSSSAMRPSSITPPPSSQAPPRVAPRSITPDASAAGAMSSPPPTVNGHKREVASAGPNVEELAQYTKQELIEMVEKAKAENHKLDAEASEARMSAAHYKLQYRLLTIESEEALKRMEVEHDITRREVEVLQGTGRESTNIEYTQKLKAYCKSLEDDLYAAHRRIEKAKRLIESKEDQIVDAKEEIGRLHERIRQNREHINVLRSPGGPLHVGTPKAPATPHQYQRGTPRYTPSSNRQVRYPASQDNQERFNALLLAGSVLSQENNSAPSTPTIARRPDPRTPNKHNRGVQSLSSFPTTPGSGRPITANSTLLPAPEFSQNTERINVLAHNALQHMNQTEHRRRKSRDSTISASDHEEIVRATNASYREESDEEVQESQASQSATEMLRADPRESFEVAASRTHTPVPGDKAKVNLQSKLFAPISKGGAEKRKRDEEYGPVKKARSDGEAIGLGIGFESGRG
ncbi:uncharacterized protein LY89DRAFT_682414 [Mollisia scopiformis]|uniref:Uncharacterized protein n=1 Tax=Mollisia scopiformis TaxID=149040 RepID=A0A194XKI2_MOLSC|nr:uncharacterized protein LY89DRAFT_682414 [Mollisia scopiformis]KUJ20720.1 hypothetical protein LY89DRAFT_682414 [Mollisia scopiformis]